MHTYIHTYIYIYMHTPPHIHMNRARHIQKEKHKTMFKQLRPFYVLTSCTLMGSTLSGSYVKGVKSPKNTGNFRGIGTRRMLVSELLVCEIAVRESRETSQKNKKETCLSNEKN